MQQANETIDFMETTCRMVVCFLSNINIIHTSVKVNKMLICRRHFLSELDYIPKNVFLAPCGWDRFCLNGECLVSTYFWKNCIRLLNYAYWPPTLLWSLKNKRVKSRHSKMQRLINTDKAVDSIEATHQDLNATMDGDEDQEEEDNEQWTRLLLNETANALLSGFYE
jgi:hypothetical protein